MIRELPDHLDNGNAHLLWDVLDAIATASPTTETLNDVTDHLESEHYQSILDRIEYEPSSDNPNLYVSIETAVEQRCEQAEAAAEQQSNNS